MRHRPPPAASHGRTLKALHRDRGWPARLALALPLASGALLVPQALTLAAILDAAIVGRSGLGALAAPLATLLGLIGLRAGIGLAAELLAIDASEAIKLDLRARLVEDMLERQPVWTASRSSGALSTLVIEQVEALDGFFVRYLPAMLQAALLPVAFAAVVLPVDWVAGLIFLVTAPLIPVFMMLAGWGAEAASRAQAGALARLTGRFADRLRGLVTLRLFGREAAETAGIHEASEALRRRSMAVLRIAFLSSAVLEFFAALGVAGVALYIGLTFLGLVGLHAGPLTLTAGMFCLLMAPEVYQPLRLLAAHYHDRAAARAALAEIEASLGALPGPRAPDVPAATAPARAPAGLAVELADVSLATPEGVPVLAHVDLAVAPGSHIALVGPSGSGKSSLLEAVARLRPHGGSIRLDGVDLGTIAEPQLRAETALAGQRPRLFAGSIADNIRLGRPDAGDVAVRLAAQRALVTDFADALPAGLATRIGENGLGLSGGEAQRVALARLYLRNPTLLLLDEPTAHLDPATEARLLDNLMQFAAGRTLLVATHSAAVAARMQRSYRLAGGRILPALHPSRSGAPGLRGVA